ncbi:MAG: patatin-like phospholipase family protein [Cellulosilyticaceae bacterium]
MPTFRILSFDGGGIRGALSARILKRLCDRYPQLISQTNLFAGTSTGSLIALGLAYGKTPDFIDNIYNSKDMKYIFTHTHRGPLRPKFDNKHLRNVLLDIFPNQATLASLDKYVFIPSFNVKGYTGKADQAVFFNNLTNNPTISETLINAALYSSAAPIYFPSVNNFIDGGIIANSPTAAPLIFTQAVFPNTYRLNNFRLLSIGTGFYPSIIDKDSSKWGVLQWSINPFCELKYPLISFLLEDSPELECIYCEQLLKYNFFRINPELPHRINLSDYKKVQELKELGNSIDLSKTYDFIENIFLK